VITRELFEEWKKPPCFPTAISASVRSSGSRRRFDYVDRESRTDMIAVDQMASEILPKKLRKAARILCRLQVTSLLPWLARLE
jgi:hypothetical protein